MLFATITGAKVHAAQFTIAWGAADNQLGLTTGTETERQGPLTFVASPTGGVIVADTVKRRIVEFSSSGEYVTTLRQNVAPVALAFDAQQRLITLEGNAIDRRNADGSWSRVVTIVPDVSVIEGYGQELFDESGYLGINDPDGQVYLFTPNGNGRSASKLHGRSFGGASRLWVGAQNGKLQALSSASIAKNPLTRPATEAVLLRGALNKGETLLVERHHFISPQPRAEIEAVSKSGKTQVVATSTGLDFTTTYKRFDVGPNGAIASMRTTPTGVTFEITQVQP